MGDQSRPGEFDLIASYFRPLAKKEGGALGLTDDAAVLDVRDGQKLVVTMDTLVSGVHFLEFTPPHFIAARALRDCVEHGGMSWCKQFARSRRGH